MKLRSGDEIKVVLGKDKGKTGKVEKLYPKEDKVLVGGVNQYKRHMKGQYQGQKSEIVTLTKPLPVASIALVCPRCHKVTRVGFEITKTGKDRICRKCGKVI